MYVYGCGQHACVSHIEVRALVVVCLSGGAGERPFVCELLFSAQRALGGEWRNLSFLSPLQQPHCATQLS